MNANFRRDYLYQFETGAFRGVFLRYLKFDTKTKEYIFIEGEKKFHGELQIRVKQHNAGYIGHRIKKLHCIGYAETDQYKKNGLLSKLKKTLGYNDLIIGRTYKCISDDLINPKPMVLTRLENGSAYFDNTCDTLEDGKWYRHQTAKGAYISTGEIKLELVG